MAYSEETIQKLNGFLQASEMPFISNALSVFGKSTEDGLNISSAYPSNPTKVYISLMFLRIGEIDTLNERYQARASIESRWSVDLEEFLPNLSSDEQQRLNYGKSISLIKYTESHWYPQLYIENALGDLEEQIRYSAKKSKLDDLVYICEHRTVKGLFWEKLELQNFPSDVQDLSISIASMHYNDRVRLISDPHHASGVNREAFVDQQEWLLYEHVDTQRRFVKEFLFQEDNEEDDDQNDHDTGSRINTERNRAILTVTCHAARRSNYFYWNGFCLIFLIGVVSFCIFAIPPNLSANRIQISCTLLLASITFRWTPTVSYLTALDKYAILCLFNLVINCIWHAIIGGLIFAYIPDSRITSTNWFVRLDRYVLYGSVGIYTTIHAVLLIWLFSVPLKHRRNLEQKDVQYRQLLTKGSDLVKKNFRKPSNYISVSMKS